VEPVGRQSHAIPVGDGCDAPELRDAPAHRRVGLQNRGGALVQQFLVAPTSSLDLSGGYRNGGALNETGVVFEVVGTERLPIQ
jgi:hypothetical protein